MSQVQVANMYGLGALTRAPFFVYTDNQLTNTVNNMAAGGAPLSQNELTALELRSGAVVSLIAGAVGAGLGALFSRNKRRGAMNWGLIGFGSGAMYSGAQLMSDMDVGLMRQFTWALGIGATAWGGWRAYKGR